ncbi:MAG: GTP-sensing pleiotropic transcriptional regulator CodY [Dethiobacteria bacterium]
MIVSSLLEKTRFIRKTLQTEQGVKLFEVIEVLKNVIHANVYITDTEGKILKYALVDEFYCELMDGFLKKGEFPEDCKDYLLHGIENRSKINLTQKNNECVFMQSESCVFTNIFTTLVPILGQDKRLGTLILTRLIKPFDTGDLILAETVATVSGMAILNSKSEKIEKKIRNKMTVQQAIGALSYSELEAAVRVFNELDTDEGLIVTSKIADKLNITRSVIVNALRKLKSAGVIETHSLGMKGTYLRVLNPYLLDQLEKEDKHWLEMQR